MYKTFYMLKFFTWISKITLVVLFLVILAGSIVRMTGSGMGCPDWPKCFGKWIPPTDRNELPDNYKDIYSAKREKKILDFTKLLDDIGFKTEAEEIRNDKSLLIEQDFNATKTWTEYINRLLGFLAGNLILFSVILSLFLLKFDKRIFIFSFVNLILISFTAWFGSIVVATNLLPWIISIHMGIALIIAALQVYILHLAIKPKYRFDVSLIFIWLLRLLIVLTFIQIILGTQVRQQVDEIALQLGEVSRNNWSNHFGVVFYVHRSFSISILILVSYLFYRNWKYTLGINIINFLLLIVIIEIISGVILSYLGMPKYLQPTHLLLSAILLAIEFYILFRTRRTRRVIN